MRLLPRSLRISSGSTFPHTHKSPRAVVGTSAALLASLVFLLGCGGGSTQAAATPSTPSGSSSTGTYTLTWSDEFNGADGSTPDPAKWTYDIGGNGWGNEELEYYTSRPENAHIEGGNLVMTAIKESYTGSDGVTRDYTSARLKTQGLFSQAYGKFEARVKMPKGQGIWPAFWALGSDITSVNWPQCGEIDIMETVGKSININYGTLHGPGYSGGSALTGNYTLPSGTFADDFHVFSIEWEPNVIRFYVDNTLYETRTSADVPSGAKWVYDHPFFLLLDVAVGGRWPGNPDETSTFPQKMLVDYVRVYTKK